MIFESPKDAMPWVGLYTAIASLICTLAMATDVIQAFRQWKLWFPNKFFTLNAATITLIAIAMKLPMDLTSGMHTHPNDKVLKDELFLTKTVGLYFLITMLANLLPSLGLMDDRELLANIAALGILVITIVVNVFIQIDSFCFVLELLIVSTVWPSSVALTVSATRKKLEHRYKESQQLVSCHQQKWFSSKEHKRCLKRYWMMTETRNPQFVIAYSPISSTFGVFCSILAFNTFYILFDFISENSYEDFGNYTDYKWSMKIILIVQQIGVIVGSIAPIFRCFTSIGHYNLSKKWSKNQLNVFRVEKHWIQTLKNWKSSHVHSHISGRHSKIIFHYTKNTLLNFCMAIHIAVLVICKIICLIPRTFLILLSCCWFFFKSFWKWFRKIENAPTSNLSSELEEYTMYVVQIEEEAKLSKRTLRNTLRSITQLLDESIQKEPRDLIKLLDRSNCFNGVVKFDNNQVPPLYIEEPPICWSLVVVTLTSIALALPNIAKGHFKELLVSMKEGLQIVRHIEECLNVDGNSIKARKSARRLWTEVEVYHTWLQIGLQKKAHKGKTLKEILNWLGDEAAKIVIQSKSSKKASIDYSPFKFIVASSMYRISQTILLQCNEQENLSNYMELFEWISTTIADILSACFTNLPCVIQLSCHHHAIEKRGDGIQNAAQLLGKSKKILKMLKARQLPNIDLDSMAYIDKWRVLTMSQMPNGSNGGASTSGIRQDSSTSNGSLTITIM